MRDLSLCKFFEQKNLNLLDLILYKSIIKSLELSDFLIFDTKDISEYILVLYFKLIRNNTIPIKERDFVHKNIVRLIEKSKLITLQNTSELSDKEVFINLKRHSDYTTTIEKINNHINRFTIIKNQKGPSEKLIYDYDLSAKVIKVLEKEKLINSLECINLYIKNHLKNQPKPSKNENVLKLIKKPSTESFEEVNTNSKIPNRYQLTKHKSMKTKDLFEQFDIFLEKKSINHQEADLNQFYMYLKNNYKNQSYNRNNLLQFINKHYRPDYTLFIEEESANLTNQFKYFKKLDLLNVQLGFNLTELITINDLNNLLNFPKKALTEKYVAKSTFSDDEFSFIRYFKGLDYSNMDEIERYNAFLENQKILKNNDLYHEKLDYQLSLVDPVYSRKDILKYLRFSGNIKLYEILVQEEFWDKPNVLLSAPYLVKTLIDVLKEFSTPLSDRVGDYIDSILNDREQYIHQERFNKRTLEALGTKMGLTRERVRQIESKANRKLKSNNSLNIIQKLNPLIQSKFSNLYYIVFEDIENALGRFTSVFIELNLYHNEHFAYFENEEYITFKKHEISRVDNYIGTFENYFDRNEYRLLKENFKVFFPIIDPDIFDSLMLKRFQINSDYYFDKNYFKTKSDRVKFILFEFYQDGIKVFDDDTISEFTNLYQKHFGIDDFKNQSTRTIGSYITRYTEIIGRGLYSIVSKSIKLNTEIVEYIKSLIYQSKLIYKETLFYRVKSKFNHLSFESMEELSRVLKKYIDFPSNRYYYSVEEEYLDYQRYLVEFLENNSGVFRIEDIEAEFKGINHKTILNIYNQSELVLSNINQRYIHVKHVGLNNHELNTIKLIIDQLIANKEFIHVLDVYEKILMDETIVMDEEVLNDSLGLFNVIKYYFNEEFNLFRPLIGKNNVYIGPFESMIDHYFFSSEIVEIEPLKKFVDYMQKPTAIHAIFEIQHPKYYLVNSKEFRLKASLGITSQVSNTIEKIMKNFMKSNPNLGIEDFTQWDLLPKIKVEWTPQLIYSLAKDDFHDSYIKFSNKKYNNLKFRIEWRT